MGRDKGDEGRLVTRPQALEETLVTVHRCKRREIAAAAVADCGISRGTGLLG
jgi:hypothetical protein